MQRQRFFNQATVYEDTYLQPMRPYVAILAFIFTGAFLFHVGALFYFHAEGALFGLLSYSACLWLLLSFITLWILYDYRRHKAATELRRALFSALNKLTSSFYAIIKHDGTVVHITPSYQHIFTEIRKKSRDDMDALCKLGKINQADHLAMQNALRHGQHVTASMQLAQGEESRTATLALTPISIARKKTRKQHMQLAMGPLERPSGYFYLYSDKDIDSANLIGLFSDFNTGFYCVDDHQVIKKSNRFFRQYTHFNPDKPQCMSELLSESGQYDPNQPSQSRIVTFGSADKTPTTCYLHEITPQYGPTNSKQKQGIIIPLPGHYLKERAQNDSSILTTHDFQDSPIATAIVDQEWHIMHHNRAFSNVIGQHFNNNKNPCLLEFIEAENCPNISNLLKTLNSKNQSIKPIEINVIERKEQSASLYIHPIHTTTTSPYYLIHLIDTTDFKNLELRFTHSQKMQAVGQLAGGIAHDFNNLLTAMIGFCDLLLMRHPAGDPSFADIMQIKQNSNRAANLVRQLLAFSRKQTLQPKIIDITDVLADLSHLISRLIGENIELHMEHGDKIGYVKVDHGQLEQVIVNLAVNARDAMKRGGKLTIKTSQEKVKKNFHIGPEFIAPEGEEHITPGDYVRIDVTDNGSGIDEEVQRHVFEPFFSTKDAVSGTGLGLSTVYGIVKQTNGYIYISSQLEQGTTFSIFLKRYDEDAAQDEGLPAKATPKIAPVDLSGTGTILLVEDEAPVRLFSSNALSKKGYRVVEAADGEKALELIKERGKEIDLIVSDVVMPGITGPAMVEQILPDFPNMKVIFISGYAEDTFMSTYGEERNFHFLSKPYTLKQLAGKVKEVLEE